MDSSRILSCDNCRHRKIKCDKGSPCSHCKVAGKTCSTTNPKPLGPRQRVLITTQYERKIDRIEERLASLETTLKSIATSLQAANYTRPKDTAPSFGDQPFVDRTKSREAIIFDTQPRVSNDDSPAFEGESSMAVHSAQASEYLSLAVGNSPETQGLSTSLQQLKHLVSKQNSDAPLRSTRFRPEIDLDRVRPCSLQLPPSDFVSKLFRERAGRPQHDEIFELLFAYTNLDKFQELLKEMYLDQRSCSTARAVLVHGGLYYLLVESRACALRIPGSMPFDDTMEANLTLCKDNLEICYDHLDMLLPATDENVCALMLGASYAIDVSKPAISWTFCTVALGLAFSLGYHRADSSCPDSATRHRRTFAWWSLYILEKGLSLRLGRASTIQDYDITVGPMGYPAPRGDATDKIWADMMATWTGYASVQGRIYEKLYSPVALAASDEVRTAEALKLAQETEQIRLAWSRVNIDGLESDKAHYFASGSGETDKVSHLAGLTLIHRATSPSAQPTDKCIEYARMTMDAHREAYTRYETNDPDLWEAYLHWTVIHAPFVPFTVLFCHVIATSNAQDLERLSVFANSLHSKFIVTEAASKFRRVCQMFVQMAMQYIEAKARCAPAPKPNVEVTKTQKNPFGAPYPENNILGLGVPWQDFNMQDSVPIDEFDQYFAALGFAPQQPVAASSQQSMPNANFNPPDGQTMYDSTGLENWYQGNQYMLNLLEQDLSYLDTMQL